MTTAEIGQIPATKDAGKNKAISRRPLSTQAFARQSKGRPPLYPEARILAERAGVTYFHALKVVKGERKSSISEMLPSIRAELAARNSARTAA